MTLLDKVLDQFPGPASRQAKLYALSVEFDREGPFYFAKKYDVLENNSAENFACQFMSAFNSEVYEAY